MAKKDYKNPVSYKQKSIYLDENDPYQAECLDLLNLCGHKQARFLGLLAHDLITRTGMDISRMDKKSFKNYLQILELQVSTGMNPFGTMPQYGAMMPMIQADNNNIKQIAKRKKPSEEEFISEDDKEDMREALAMFGSL